MRLVVILCGVVAGIVGLGFGWWGQSAALVDIYRLPMPQFIAAVLAIHLVSANSIAGGLLVLASPRVGGMMMLASASLWLLIVALLGGGLGVSIGALIGVGAGGGLLAFLPSLSQAAFEFNRISSDESPAIGKHRPAPVVEAVEARAAEDPVSFWRGTAFDTREDHSQPFTANQWRFETPDPPSIEVPADAKARPVPPPQRPPRMGEAEPWDSREDRSERVAYQIHGGQIRPLTLKTTRKRRSRGRPIVGLAALALLAVGLPTLLLIDHQMQLMPDRSSSDSAALAETAGVPAIASALPKELTAPSDDPMADARLGTNVLPPLDEKAVPPVETAALPMPLPLVAYPTPFDYCAGQRDTDEPDQSVIAAGLPSQLLDGVREVTRIPDAEVLWRCMGGVVWVCAQPPGGIACSKVPTTVERHAYCQQHPGTTGIAAAGGSWNCDGTLPVVPGGDQRTTDPRGYDRLAWLGLSRAAKDSG